MPGRASLRQKRFILRTAKEAHLFQRISVEVARRFRNPLRPASDYWQKLSTGSEFYSWDRLTVLRFH